MTFAARNENIFVARALIKHGADPHLPVDGGVPPAFPQDVAFADLMKVLVRAFGDGTNAG